MMIWFYSKQFVYCITVCYGGLILLKTIYEMIKHQNNYYVKWQTGTVKDESRGNSFVP